MKLKKIALFTDGIYPFVIGGMQKHSYYLAKFLARSGIHVDLYHCMPRDDKNASLFKKDTECIEGNAILKSTGSFADTELKFIKSYLFQFPEKGIIPGHYLRASYRYSELLLSEFKKNPEVDFIYVKGFSGWKLFEEKKKGGKFPLTGVKFHGMNMYDQPYSFRSRFEQMMLRPAAQFNMDQADVVFSYGGKVTDLIHRKAKVPSGKIIEIPTGIESDWLKTEKPVIHTSKSFLFVGRYERLKGIEELMIAIKDLKPEADFVFHFIGPIPGSLKLNLPGIIYHGSISDAVKVREIMDKCDALVCPSFSEGMPNVILEAMSCGLFVIASDVGAVNVMVSGKTGKLISPGNVQELKKAMLELISMNEDSLLNKKSGAVNKVREHFLWEKIIGKTIAAIDAKLPEKR